MRDTKNFYTIHLSKFNFNLDGVWYTVESWSDKLNNKKKNDDNNKKNDDNNNNSNNNNYIRSAIQDCLQSPHIRHELSRTHTFK